MLKIDPARAKELISQLQSVSERIAAIAKGRPVSIETVSSLYTRVFES